MLVSESRKIIATVHWTHLRLNDIWVNSFCLLKTNNRMLFLTAAFSSNVATSNVYKWRHSDVIVRIKSATIRIFRNFQILKINRMMPFCNLFMERPSYNKNDVDLYAHNDTFCICSLSVYNSELPTAEKMTSCQFSRKRISAILNFSGPITDSLKSPCR